MDGAFKERVEMETSQPARGPISSLGRPVLLRAPGTPLAGSRVFRGLSHPECLQVCARGQQKSFEPGQVLFASGDPMAAVMVLASGRVKISQSSSCGKEVILRVDPPGEILTTPGKPAMQPHSHDAVALERSLVVCWDVRVFEDLERRFPTIRLNSLDIVTERLKDLEGSFLALATEQVAQRLARMLLRLSRTASGEDGEVRVPLTNEQLAQMTGTTLFSVSRILSQWEGRGIVATRRKAVIVRDIPALCSAAETPE